MEIRKTEAYGIDGVVVGLIGRVWKYVVPGSLPRPTAGQPLQNI
jgi:hypothetical protein